MEAPLISDAAVLARIEAFCERHAIRPTTFGRAALSDGNLIANLRAGRSLTLKNAERVVRFMAEYRPTTQEIAA